MGRKYSIDGADTNTANTTILGLTSATTVRPKVYDFVLASDAAPADNVARYALQRYTVSGTSTGVTPRALDPGDPASLASAGKAHTVEPTYTAGAILLAFAVNMRATFRWFALPGAEIVLPATADNGLGLQSLVATTAYNVHATIHFEE